MSGLLFENDTTLMAESESNLQRYVSAFVRENPTARWHIRLLQ